MAKVVKKAAKKATKKVPARSVPVRSRSVLIRFAAVLLPAGMLVLAFSFAASLLWSSPLVARADENHLADGSDQTLTTYEGIATSTILTGTDLDGDTISFSVSNLPDPATGTLTCAGSPCVIDEVFGSTNGTVPMVVFTPAPGFIGTTNFDFTADDGTNAPYDPENPEIVNQDGTITIQVIAPAAPDCSGVIPTDLEVNVTQSITNDPDSGFHGNWALDNFTRTIKVWNSNVEGYHCAEATDAGTFVTTGPLGPQNGDALAADINGTMTGSTGRMVIHGTFNPAEGWVTTGSAPAQDCSIAGTCEEGLTHKWVNNYFTEPTYDYPNWGWTYTSCGHSSWTNAAAGSTGDIVTGPTEEVCTVENPAPSSGGSSGTSDNNGGGTVLGLIGSVFVNPSSGGQVLGTSTAATSTDDLPAGCSAYLGGYLRMGGKNNVEDVKKLQLFLNTHTDAGLPVSGVFGKMTFEAVKKFQLANWEKVLKPWVSLGLSTDHTATGYVYKTTKHAINLLSCSTYNAPEPQLP